MLPKSHTLFGHLGREGGDPIEDYECKYYVSVLKERYGVGLRDGWRRLLVVKDLLPGITTPLHDNDNITTIVDPTLPVRASKSNNNLKPKY